MEILYIDNYRGFEDTFIPFKSVNFLVGENSTGKSSILSLINLLYTSDFWINYEFKFPEINLGSFDEIATKNSDKDYFEIGFFDYKVDSTNDEISEHRLWLMKFQNNKGIPAIQEFRYGDNKYNIIVNIAKNKKTIKYIIKNVDKNLINSTKTIDFFKDWIYYMNSIEKKGFKIIKIDPKITKSILFLKLEVIFNLKNKLDKKIKSDKEIKETDLISDLSELISFGEKLIWIAPIRAKPKRAYDNYGISKSPEGDHTPYLLKDILISGKSSTKNSFEKKLNSFGMESGLFDTISVKNYSKESLSPFELDIVLNGNSFKISNVGYGVSQILPIIVEFITSTDKEIEKFFSVQQPEIHLHPRAQAALGEFIYLNQLEKKNKILIETHSEYIIDRFRIKTYENRNEKDKKVDSQVLFFERTDRGNKIHIINIENSGKYSEDQPKSFMDFFIKENLNLLVI